MVLQLLLHRVSITHLSRSGIGKIFDKWQRSEFFSYIAPHIEDGRFPGILYFLDRYSSGERTFLLCADVRMEYEVRAGLESSWVAHVLFSVRVPD